MDKGNLLSHLGITLTYISVVKLFYIIVGSGVRKSEIKPCLSLLLATSDTVSKFQISHL